MRKTTYSLGFVPALLALACGLALLAPACRSPRTADAGSGLPAPETAAGFPVYADALVPLMVRFVDGAILEQARLLEALAGLPQVRACEWAGMEGLVAAFQKAWGDSGIYWFALPDGRYYTVERGLVDQSLADRSYFPDLLAGKTVTGALVVSRSTGRKSAVIAVPVVVDGKTAGALGASLFLEPLDAKLAAAIPLPEGMVFFALGADGTTVLHQRLDLVFDNPLAQDSPTLKAAAEKMLAAEAGEVEYEFNDFRKRVRYAASPVNGWRYAIGVNLAKPRA